MARAVSGISGGRGQPVPVQPSPNGISNGRQPAPVAAPARPTAAPTTPRAGGVVTSPAARAAGEQVTDVRTAQFAGTPYDVGYQPDNNFISRQDFMYGRDPMGADSAINRVQMIANSAATNLNSVGADARQFGTGVGTQLAQAGNTSGNALFNTGTQLGGRATPQANFAPANSMLDAAGRSASALGSIEAQQGPSGAQAMLQAGANQSNQQALALARSGRGMGGSAQGMAEAQRANAANMQQIGNQSAMLSAQENAAFRQRQAANLGAASQLQQGIAGQRAGQAQFGADAELRSRGINDQAQFQFQNAGAQTNLQGIQAGGQLGMQGFQTQGQLGGAAANAYFSGEQQSHAVRTAQQQGDQARVGTVMNRYAIDAGQPQSSIAPALIQGGATLLGAGVGAFAGSPQAGAAIGSAGGAAGASAYNESQRPSDIRAKENIQPVDNVGDMLARLETLSRDKGVSMRHAPASSFEYKDPARHGEGSFVGPMAQDLERNPVTAQAVRQAPDGTKMVDTPRLVMPLVSAVGEQQRDIDEIFARLDAVAQNRERPETAGLVTSDRRAKKNVRAY